VKKQIDTTKLLYYIFCGMLGGVLGGNIIIMNIRVFPLRPFLAGTVTGIITTLTVLAVYELILRLRRR